MGQSGTSGQELEAAGAAGSRSSTSLGKADAGKRVWPLPGLSSGPALPNLPFPSLRAGPHQQVLHRHQLVQHGLHGRRPRNAHNSDATVPPSPWPTDRGGESLPASDGSGIALRYGEPIASRSRREPAPPVPPAAAAEQLGSVMRMPQPVLLLPPRLAGRRRGRTCPQASLPGYPACASVYGGCLTKL